MTKKYEFTGEVKTIFGVTFKRIRALVEFGSVKIGELGGWIESENNLSHGDNAWVYDNARVFGNARVYDNAEVYGNARVFGNAEVYGNARVYDNARVFGNARVYDNAEVLGDAKVCGNAWVYDNAEVYDNARVYDNAEVLGDAKVCGNAWVYDNAEVKKPTHVMTVGSIGSRNDITTFFRTKTGAINVKCGCFRGDINEFLLKVQATHGDTKHGKAYRLAAELAMVQIDKD